MGLRKNARHTAGIVSHADRHHALFQRRQRPVKITTTVPQPVTAAIAGIHRHNRNVGQHHGGAVGYRNVVHAALHRRTRPPLAEAQGLALAGHFRQRSHCPLLAPLMHRKARIELGLERPAETDHPLLRCRQHSCKQRGHLFAPCPALRFRNRTAPGDPMLALRLAPGADVLPVHRCRFSHAQSFALPAATHC